MVLTSLWIKIVAVIVAAGIGLAATYWFKFKPDNPVEQAAEMVIYHHTGYDIDLSPYSGEELELHPDLRA